MLRTGLLTGRTVVLAGAGAGLRAALDGLGATVCESGSGTGRVDTLVADTRGAFSAAGGGYDGVRAAVAGAFATTRDVAVEHWLGHPGGGQVVLLAPAPGSGRHAEAARAALENLVRTLGTEWARHAVTAVAVLPGDATGEAALGDLVAWLASPAGAYVSGTALRLDASPGA